MRFAEIVEQLGALPPYRRLQAIRIACEDALAVWRRYRRDGVPLEYRDSVVGLLHTVDDTLPARALADVDRVLAGEPADPAITAAYLEPLTAMQDGDLDLPDPIAMAYYAISNLRRIVIGETSASHDERILLTQITSSLGALDGDLLPSRPDDAKLDAWANEWWTRVWDAWASTAEPAYEPSPLSEAAFAALSRGDLDAALEALGDDLSVERPVGSGHAAATRTPVARDPRVLLLRAIVLALLGREDEAMATAARGLGIADADARATAARGLDGRGQSSIPKREGPNAVESVPPTGTVLHRSAPALQHWLAQHLVARMPETIAVSDDRTRYVVIRGGRRVVRDLARKTVASDTTYRDRVPRLVRFGGGRLWMASDRVDAQGVWATSIEGEWGDGSSHDDIVGCMAVAALGPGSIVRCHPSRVVLNANDQRELLGELPVIGAAIAEDRSVVVTHDGVRVSIWRRDPPSCARIVGPGGVAPRRIELGGTELLVVWADRSASLHRL